MPGDDAPDTESPPSGRRDVPVGFLFPIAAVSHRVNFRTGNRTGLDFTVESSEAKQGLDFSLDSIVGSTFFGGGM